MIAREKKIGCRQLQTRDLRSHGLHHVRTNWHVQACQRTNVQDEDMSRTNDTKSIHWMYQVIWNDFEAMIWQSCWSDIWILSQKLGVG
jgi:hypothetical protein